MSIRKWTGSFAARFCVVMVGLAMSLPGCASTPESAPSDPQALSGTDEQIFIGDSVEMNYDPNVIMKRAESYFEKESFAEALVEYKHFLDLHRQHVLAPYAQYKIGMSHIKMFSSIDRDPAPIEKAMTAFQKLRLEFPGSQYETEASVKIRMCRDLLAQHHLFVGKFYFRRESYLAAAHRFEKVIQTYPGSKTSAEAMFHLAKTYRAMGAKDWATSWLVKLIRQFPDAPNHEKAMTLLAQLQPDHPELLVAERIRPVAGDGRTPSLNGHTARRVEMTRRPEVRPVSAPSSPGTPTPQANGEISVDGEAEVALLSEVPHSCSVGSWCESSGLSSNGHGSATGGSSATPAVCELGQWC